MLVVVDFSRRTVSTSRLQGPKCPGPRVGRRGSPWMALTSSKPRSEKVPSRTVNDTLKKKKKKKSETGPKQRKSKLANTKVISENTTSPCRTTHEGLYSKTVEKCIRGCMRRQTVNMCNALEIRSFASES